MCLPFLYKPSPSSTPSPPHHPPDPDTPLHPPTPALAPEPPPSTISARNYNALSSRFGSFPTEILLLIQRYTDAPSIMTLRGTCSRFLHLFPNPTSNRHYFGVDALRKAYSQRRREFRAQELVRRETENELPDGEVGCGSCLAAHRTENFYPGDAGLAPSVRECVCWRAKLRLCEHRVLALGDLKMRKADAWCGRPHSGLKSHLGGTGVRHEVVEHTPLHVLRNATVLNSGGGRGVRIGVVGRGVDAEGRPERMQCSLEESEFWYAKSREVVLRAEVVVLQCREGEKVDTQGIVEGLREIDGRGEGALCLCPHLDLESVEGLLRARPYTDCPNLRLHTESTVPCPPSSFSPQTDSLFCLPFFHGGQPQQSHPCDRSYKCPHSQCETYFSFFRARYVSFSIGFKDELLLCVVRHLGACRDPFEDKWLVQLVEPENGRPLVALGKLADDGTKVNI